ncbi:MAG: LytTR family DNA-binding domain-containing protein [Bacteroidetes bacterium]|nr:LytTR family DNA-binding domain-containing protein [Bacteroidota bacterium]
MKCLIVDDEAIARKILEEFVRKTNDLELAGSCKDANEASEILRNDKIDLILLDIEMPGLSGLDLLKTMNEKPAIILVTSKDKYAAEAFEYDVIDYIVKPPTYVRFLKAVNKVSETLKGNVTVSSDNFIFAKVDSRLIKIDTSYINYIEANGDYVNISTTEKNITVYSTMKALEDKIKNNNFVRVHRSYIVNIKNITDIEDNNLLVNKKIIPIGASYKTSLMKRLKII